MEKKPKGKQKPAGDFSSKAAERTAAKERGKKSCFFSFPFPKSVQSEAISRNLSPKCFNLDRILIICYVSNNFKTEFS